MYKKQNKLNQKVDSMKNVIVLELNEEEKAVVVNSLVDFRNNLISKEIDTDIVDVLLLKVLDAPLKRKMFARKYLDAR